MGPYRQYHFDDANASRRRSQKFSRNTHTYLWDFAGGWACGDGDFSIFRYSCYITFTASTALTTSHRIHLLLRFLLPGKQIFNQSNTPSRDWNYHIRLIHWDFYLYATEQRS